MTVEKLSSSKTILLVIDVQESLVEVMSGKDALIDNLSRLVRGAKILGLPILWTEQVPEKLGPTIPAISHLLKDMEPMKKSCFSCVDDGKFLKALSGSGKGRILICGIESHVCIWQTASDLLERKYKVFVASDAVASRKEADKDAAIDRMKGAGAQIVTVEMALFEMLKDAGDPKFRELLKIVK